MTPEWTLGYMQGAASILVSAFVIWLAWRVLREMKTGREAGSFGAWLLGRLRRHVEAAHRRAQWAQDVYEAAHGGYHEYRRLRAVARGWDAALVGELDQGDADRSEPAERARQLQGWGVVQPLRGLGLGDEAIEKMCGEGSTNA